MARNVNHRNGDVRVDQAENPWAFLYDSEYGSIGASEFLERGGDTEDAASITDSRFFVWFREATRALKEKAAESTEGAKALDAQSSVERSREEMPPKSAQRIHEHFAVFSKSIMGIDFAKAHSVEEHCFMRNVSMVRYIAVIVLICDVFWLINNALTNNALNLDYPSARVGLILQITMSLYMLLLSFFYKKRQGAFIRISFILYSAAIIFGTAVLVDAKDVLMLQQGVIMQQGQIAFVSIFLLITGALPLPSKFDSALVIIMVLCGFMLPMLSPAAAAYPVRQSAILTMAVIVVYIYFWLENKHNALKDIESVKTVERMAQASYIDSLTSAFNRQALDYALGRFRKNEDMVSVGFLVFDLDDFRQYNYICSHAKGDEALQVVCETIEDALDQLGHSHPFLYRYGGEEFVVMVPNPTPFRLMTMGVMLKNAIWNANLARDDESEYPRLTITVGCAIEQIEDLRKSDYDAIKNADIQRYIGKRAKKNCVVIHGDVYR